MPEKSRRERVLTSLAFEKPDRAPLQISFSKEFAERLMDNFGMKDYKHQTMSGTSTKLEELTYQDMLLVAVSWVNGYFSSSENEFYDDWGVKFKQIEYTTKFGTGRYAEVSEHPLSSDEKIVSYSPPCAHNPQLYVGAKTLIDTKKDSWYLVGCAVTTIFETACALRGMEQLLVDMLLDPDLANAIFEIPFNFHKTSAIKLAEMGYDMIRLGDDVGGQGGMIISPKHWQKYLKPKMAELIEAVKNVNKDISIAYHSDGDIQDIIPDLIEIGVNVLNPIQPQAMDPNVLKKKYGKNLVLWGTIDIQHTLPFGTQEEVKLEVQDRLLNCGYNGGLIVSPTHHVQLDTPIENFNAMLHAVVEAP